MWLYKEILECSFLYIRRWARLGFAPTFLRPLGCGSGPTLVEGSQMGFYIQYNDLRLPVFCSVTLCYTFHVFSSKYDKNSSLRICFASEISSPFRKIRLAHVLRLRSISLAFFRVNAKLREKLWVTWMKIALDQCLSTGGPQT